MTASELFNKLPIETLLQLDIPSNQSSQSSEQKLGANINNKNDQRHRSSSFSKLSSSQALDALKKAQSAGQRLKNEIPDTYLMKPSTAESNRRKSFQLQTPVEMHSEYDINYQDAFINESNDYWLRHRSLPNIQELVEDSGSENPSSPTSKDVNSKFTINELPSSSSSTKPNGIKVDVRTSSRKAKEQSKELMSRKEDEAANEQNKHNAQEKRTLYSKASKSSSSSNQSSSSLQRKCRKKIPIHLSSSSKSNSLKQSSTDSDSSYFTAHSVHITIPEMAPLDFFEQASNDSISSTANNNNLPSSTSVSITMPSAHRDPQRERAIRRNFHQSNESTNSNLSYHSAHELFRTSNNNLNDSTQSLSTDAGTIPTIVVMPTSPVTSEMQLDKNVFFDQSDQMQQQERRHRLLEHFHLTKEKSKALLDTKLKDEDGKKEKEDVKKE